MDFSPKLYARGCYFVDEFLVRFFLLFCVVVVYVVRSVSCFSYDSSLTPTVSTETADDAGTVVATWCGTSKNVHVMNTFYLSVHAFYDALRDIDTFLQTQEQTQVRYFSLLSRYRAIYEKENDVFNNVVKGLIPTG